MGRTITVFLLGAALCVASLLTAERQVVIASKVPQLQLARKNEPDR